MFTNLIDLISEKDKQTMINYIDSYGVVKKDFIGLDKWLSNWSHSNQILYKILGNQLIREFDFEYEKNKDTLQTELRDKILKDSEFKRSYHTFFETIILPATREGKFDLDQKWFFNHLLDSINFVEDKIMEGIKYKAPNAKKMLQIQAGAKPMRAITRVMEYFKDVYTFEGFDDFRVQHSLIMNDKKIKGKICLSIHPLDFMTMSDNASNWQSCMSWVHDGCYRVGTIEMMNSNNVICAYLKNDSTPFVFTNPNTGEVGEWVNKKWRQLFYVNKNIIMSGKAYPYIQEDITRFILNTLKSLVKENCGWDYEYGIEDYTDMRNVDTAGRMEYQRMKMHAKTKDIVKHNIIWDTKGMYNDMLNDNTYSFLCYRNKVNNTKIYSVSGKCPCLKCGKQIIEFNEYEQNYYNDRYGNTGAVLCKDCYDSYDGCDICERYAPTMTTIKYTYNNNLNDTINLCKDCAEKRIRICPCCGEPMYITFSSSNFTWNPIIFNAFKNNRQTIKLEERLYPIAPYDYKKESLEEILKEDSTYSELIYICINCQDKIKKEKESLIKNGDIIEAYADFYWEKRYYYIFNPKKYESWRYYNLKTPSEKPNKVNYTNY